LFVNIFVLRRENNRQNTNFNKRNLVSCWQVSEAILIGAQAVKDNRMSVEEVEFCLQELEESIESQKQVDKALGTFKSV
jgi:hypothetical protein